MQVDSNSGNEQHLRAKVWNLRPLGGMPTRSTSALSDRGGAPPSRAEIFLADVPELLAIGRNFADDGRVAYNVLEAVQERANEDDDLSSPWYGLPRAVDDDLRRE